MRVPVRCLPGRPLSLTEVQGLMYQYVKIRQLRTEIINETDTPTNIDFMDLQKRSLSPRVVENAQATFGPISGAITIAPIITATLSFKIPMEATRVDKTTRKTNIPVISAFEEISLYSSSLLKAFAYPEFTFFFFLFFFGLFFLLFNSGKSCFNGK